MPPGPSSIRTPLRKFLPFLVQARDQNLNEADTVQRILKVFEQVLGYDAMTEITRECLVKGKYVDIAIKIDGIIRLLVEVKSASTVLRDRHTDQARAYAAEGNIRWVVLTNGLNWNLYHLTFEEGIEYDLVFGIDLSAQEFDQAADQLILLHRENLKRDLHEELWKTRSALSPQSLARAVFNEPVLRLIRRELRRDQGVSIDEDRVVEGLRQILSIDAREQMGPIKVRRRRRKKEVPPQGNSVAPAPSSLRAPNGPSQEGPPGKKEGKDGIGE